MSPSAERLLHSLKSAQGLAIVAGAILLTVYFGYHAIHGTRGIIAENTLLGEIRELEDEYRAVKELREAYQAKVDGMDYQATDPDLLEERLRSVLGFVRADEVIVFVDPWDKAEADAGASADDLPEPAAGPAAADAALD
ncbi:MAG: septum formation initiator family protein [Geminicoccaceae bacterium]